MLRWRPTDSHRHSPPGSDLDDLRVRRHPDTWANRRRTRLARLRPLRYCRQAEGDLAPDAQGRPTRLIAMLRALLEERFQVKVHTEMRETQTYALMLSNKDGRLGPRLKPSDCHGPDIAPPPDPTGQSHPCGRFWGNLTGNQNARGIALAQPARSLAGYWVISRPVSLR
jgi:hypothetical protein